jgi:hypothetical protein
MEVTKWLKPSDSVSRIGDSASVQAATRVNAGQTSKRTLCGPAWPSYRGRLTRLGERAKKDAQPPRRGSPWLLLAGCITLRSTCLPALGNCGLRVPMGFRTSRLCQASC